MEYTNTPEAAYPSDILSEIEPRLEQASVGKRFLNLIIDFIAYYLVTFSVSMVLALTLREQYIDFLGSIGETGVFFFALIIDFLYLSLSEAFCNGRTLGKLCTGTRAVREDGGRIGFGTAALRALIRFVPFEALSIFFGSRLWHDSWSKTYVIDIRKSASAEEVAY
ncbi:RDD family protein [Flaviaesturariibacter flavus]|uniref:RDD family protein n=1 Tax=Flaviaesturariibacter flavus TaxID=2502780 RepID=A0A4R1BAW9_9BACT|nr:RDD family protein [Flaviaesturariibacter flavus]TCJ14110.1 RDD family protein [Flaviaesturariibacter flavus]